MSTSSIAPGQSPIDQLRLPPQQTLHTWPVRDEETLFTGSAPNGCEEFLSSLAPDIRNVTAIERGGLAYIAYKRILDILLSAIALVVCSPVFALAAIAVRANDGGPVFFSQTRVGRSGRTFRCFKFRSMVVNAQTMQESLVSCSKHADARTFKVDQDPRITSVGRWLRRFSIDELPQFLNVLRGEMSIVGPRPPLPDEVALYSEQDRLRLQVKPGLTCLWQISGRSRLAFPEQSRLDIDYIRRRSLLLDLWIICRTVPAVISGDGAA